MVKSEETVFTKTGGLPARFESNFDYQLVRALGAIDSSGAAAGECFATATNVVDGDMESWCHAWTSTAQRVEAIAAESFDRGHTVSAREAFLRASTYWRTGFFFLHHTDDRRVPMWSKSRECFRSAGSLFDVPVEPIAVPYENGKSLPGYFVKPSSTMEPRATAMIMGGGDTTGEELYHFAGAAALRRGYNALLIEIPGQRGAYYSDRSLTYRPDTEVPMTYVVDYALSREDVDPERLSLSGYSMGGNFVPRAVAVEKRIKAAVANCLVPQMKPSILSLIGLNPDQPYTDLDLEMQLDLSLPMRQMLLYDMRERFGMIDRPIRDFLDFLDAFDLWGLEDKITCPLLNVCSVGEGWLIEAGHRFYERLTCQKSERIVQEVEGGEAHCQVNNRSLGTQIEFDWLDEVFAKRD
jgi:hypothetical protein